MALTGKISGTSTIKATVTNLNGRFSAAAPITLKNQVQEIRSIEDFGDVSEVDVRTGSTLIYNSENDKYEIKQIQFSDLAGAAMDGGTF